MDRIVRLIRDGLADFEIESDDVQPARLSAFVSELERWNRRMNLVGFKDAESVIRDLIWDAFFLHVAVGRSRSILDLGSGAGVVAVPMAILDGSRRVFSVDKSLKKIQFQRHIKRLLNLANLEPVQARIEDLLPLNVDALIAKAFGATSAILEKGEGHLREGGYAFIVKGTTERAVARKGFLLKSARSYRLPESNKNYQLFVYKKVS